MGQIVTDYLKQDFEELLLYSRRVADKTVGPDVHCVIACAFAGLLRSGCLHRRATGDDGYPSIIIQIGGKDERCGEQAVTDILGMEADTLIHPYEDTHSGWVKVCRGRQQAPIIVPDIEAEEKQSILPRISMPVLKKKEEEEEPDPDYDYYFDDRLPEVLEELEYVEKEAPVYLVCILASVVGLMASMVFLL